MKRTRHKRVPSVRRRALQIIAANPDGCTEAMLAALDVPADVLIGLVRGGLVIARRKPSSRKTAHAFSRMKGSFVSSAA